MPDNITSVSRLFRRLKRESTVGAAEHGTAKARDLARAVAARTAIEDALNFGIEPGAKFPAQESAEAPQAMNLRIEPAPFEPAGQEGDRPKAGKDYGKMLARYVHDSPREQRLLIYDRARSALANQEPPLQPSELEKESLLLDAAIEKLEANEI